jgi:hypothetical protein
MRLAFARLGWLPLAGLAAALVASAPPAAAGLAGSARTVSSAVVEGS